MHVDCVMLYADVFVAECISLLIPEFKRRRSRSSGEDPTGGPVAFDPATATRILRVACRTSQNTAT